jgi:hypothetical protein
MEITIKTKISREVLEDVFVTALEGGSNYWYYLSEKAVADIRKAVSKSEEQFLAVAMLKAIIDHDVKVPINDADNEDEVVGVITRALIEPRLQMLADSDSKWALEAHLQGQGDADSADVVFQYLAMGELVYG